MERQTKVFFIFLFVNFFVFTYLKSGMKHQDQVAEPDSVKSSILLLPSFCTLLRMKPRSTRASMASTWGAMYSCLIAFSCFFILLIKKLFCIKLILCYYPFFRFAKIHNIIDIMEVFCYTILK